MSLETLSTKAALLASATAATGMATAAEPVNSWVFSYHAWFALWGPTVLGIVSILSLMAAVVGKIIQWRQNQLIERQNNLLEEQMGGTSKPPKKPKSKKRKPRRGKKK